MIWWNGVSSDDLHLYVERYPSRKLPVRKTTFYSVPGRTGDYVYQQNAWENYTQAYDIYISAEDRKLPNAMTAITAWLYSANGYAKLEDSYDLDTYRMAVFEGGQDVENYLNRYGKATIEFNCKPQRWLASGDVFIDITSTNPFYTVNPTGLGAKPLISLNATGSFDFYDDKSNEHLTINDAEGISNIDCESMTFGGEAEDPYTQAGSIPKFSFSRDMRSMGYECQSAYSVLVKPRWFAL